MKERSICQFYLALAVKMRHSEAIQNVRKTIFDSNTI